MQVPAAPDIKVAHNPVYSTLVDKPKLIAFFGFSKLLAKSQFCGIQHFHCLYNQVMRFGSKAIFEKLPRDQHCR